MSAVDAPYGLSREYEGDGVGTESGRNRSNLTESRSFVDAPSGLSATTVTESNENSDTDEGNETEPEDVSETEPMKPANVGTLVKWDAGRRSARMT